MKRSPIITLQQQATLAQTYWERFSAEMEHDLYGAQKKVWNMLRGRKKKVNEEIQINTIKPETWIEYFESLYTSSDINTEEQEQENVSPEENDEDITTNEVQTAIMKIKNRKSPGTDGITNELIKYGGTSTAEELTKLYQKILNYGTIPEEWRISITIPIYKKGPKTDPQNYRGITLLQSTSKLFTKILSQKLTDALGISEEQQGFRTNRSTTDAIFILRQLIEKSIEFNKPLFLCFVDLTKAFDRIRLKDVIQLMRQKNVNEKYINIIRELNSHNRTRIKTGQGMTEEINVSTGIRQGDSLSPSLFNMVMDRIIESVKETNIGYKMGNRSLGILCYADDAVLIAENEDDLQRLLYRFNTTAQKLNMLISHEKTQSMVIAKNPIRCKLMTNEYSKS